MKIIVKKILLSCCVMGSLSFLSAQIEDGSKPFSFGLNSILSPSSYTIKAPNRDSLELADLQELKENKAFRFGIEYPLSAHFYELAAVKVLPDKSLIWTLVVTGEEALSLNFNFKQFSLKKGSKLWAYSANKKQVLGAFTYRNTNPDGNFAIAPISSDQVILELYEPAENAKTSQIQFQGIVYGYRSIFADKSDKEINGYNNSGACNININCPEAIDWFNEKNATAMLLTAGNTRKCTGTFINNTAEDGIPFLLTAAHCNSLPNSIVMLNYQSPDCNNLDGPTNMRLQGCEVVARSTYTDFTLLKFNQSPLPNYGTFFAGWSRDTTQLLESVGIHHPSTDIKKYSKTSIPLKPVIYLDTTVRPGESHWRVKNWTRGTTEGGSSGSALFNSQRQIIGQLHGGFASCNQLLQPDYYGRFDFSWDKFSDSSMQLKYWLDPLLSSPTQIAGNYHYTPFYDVDISLKIINKPNGNLCSSDIQVPLQIINFSKDTVLTIKIKVINNQSVVDHITWTGTAHFLDTLSLSYTFANISLGENTFAFEVESINEMPDERVTDNYDGFSIVKIDGFPLTVNVHAQYASVSDTIIFKDLEGNTIAKVFNFEAGNNEKEICVQESCYIISWENVQQNLTKLDVFDALSTTLVSESELPANDSTLLCYPNNTLTYDLFQVFPVPNNGSFTLQINPQIITEPLQVKISDVSGRIVHTQTIQNTYFNAISLQLAAGVYVIYLRSENLKRTYKKKIVVY